MCGQVQLVPWTTTLLNQSSTASINSRLLMQEPILCTYYNLFLQFHEMFTLFPASTKSLACFAHPWLRPNPATSHHRQNQGACAKPKLSTCTTTWQRWKTPAKRVTTLVNWGHPMIRTSTAVSFHVVKKHQCLAAGPSLHLVGDLFFCFQIREKSELEADFGPLKCAKQFRKRLRDKVPCYIYIYGNVRKESTNCKLYT